MSTQELQVDNDFASLIPPLNKDEYSHLEQSILHEGCRDPIITWNGIIVDGHHRFKICKEHNVPFKTVHKEFASRDEVFLWILNNQLARRNLNTFRRIEMARNYERAVKAQAKARQGTRNEYEEYSRISIYKTDLRYSIIYAAPSWEYDQSLKELLTLPVGRVADENYALFIWVNPSRLHEAQEVIKQWGFSNEKIAFVWVKTTEDDNGQQSYYLGQSGDLTRENVEFCLIATKGTIQRVNDNIPQGVLCPIEKEKPDYVKPELFKQLTVQLLGDLPALELFPDLEALSDEDQFNTKYNGQYVYWHMAAPEDFIEGQIANERSWEI